MRNVSAFPSTGQTAAISAALNSYLVHHQIHDEGKDEKEQDERQEGDADAADLEDILAAAFGRNPPRLTLAVGLDRSLVCMPIPFDVPHLVPVQFIRLSLSCVHPKLSPRRVCRRIATRIRSVRSCRHLIPHILPFPPQVGCLPPRASCPSDQPYLKLP